MIAIVDDAGGGVAEEGRRQRALDEALRKLSAAERVLAELDSKAADARNALAVAIVEVRKAMR